MTKKKEGSQFIEISISSPQARILLYHLQQSIRREDQYARQCKKKIRCAHHELTGEALQDIANAIENVL